MPNARELRTVAHPTQRQVEVVGLSSGSQVFNIVFTIEQAVNHIKGMIEAIDIAQGKGQKPPLILPKDFQ